MPDYQIEVHYQDDTDPVVIPLVDYEPDEAEAERESVVLQIERAQSLDAPDLVLTELDYGPLEEQVTIPVNHVSTVDLSDLSP